MKQIAEEKGIPEDRVVETIEYAIAAAYKRDFGKKGQIIKAKLDPETGSVSISQIKIVVEGVDEEGFITGDLSKFSHLDDQDEGKRGGSAEVKADQKNEDKATEEGPEETETRPKFNPEKHLTLAEARKIKKKIEIGDEIVTNLEPKMDFGRIAAQTAKQVIIQRLREVERGVIFEEFKKKEGELISGVVQRSERRLVYVDLGRTNGLLMPNEQMPQDNYRTGQRLRFLVVRVEETNKGPVILLSRSHPRLVIKLFEVEVPEIESRSVEIKSIAREAGSRSKVAVFSNEEGVDPIGSLVGQRGVRVQTVINELGGEKIDIIEWGENPVTFIANSLASAKLTGWKIDVRAPQAKMLAEEAMLEESEEVNSEIVLESKK